MSSYVVEDSIQFQHVTRNLNPYSLLLVPEVVACFGTVSFTMGDLY